MASSLPRATTVRSTAASRAARWPHDIVRVIHIHPVCVSWRSACARVESRTVHVCLASRLAVRMTTWSCVQWAVSRNWAYRCYSCIAGGLGLWPGDITQFRMHPAVDDRHVLLSALVPRPWHLSLLPVRHAV